MLSTGAASAAELARIDLNRLKRSYEDYARGFNYALNKSITLGSLDVKVRELLDQELKIMGGSITFLQDLLSTLHFKRHKRFYCLVLDAIRLKPDSPARVLQSFTERISLQASAERRQHRTEEDNDLSKRARKIKFFMIGDRYDNDCEPLLDISSPNPGRVAVGTCRLLSGSRATKFCPPSAEPPRNKKDDPKLRKPTMFVCDTLAQIGHILSVHFPWEQIDDLTASPPVLLEARDNRVFFPRTTADDLEDLSSRFKDLAWARQSKELKEEFTIQEMLVQIERDLAGCDNECLCGFFDALRSGWLKDVEEAEWEAADSGEQGAIRLFKGGLKILEGINWWRRSLRSPLGTVRDNPSATLAWALGSLLLTCFPGIPVLGTSIGDLREADKSALDVGILAERLLEAIPYSPEGIAIVEALRHHPFNLTHDFRKGIRDWIDGARLLRL